MPTDAGTGDLRRQIKEAVANRDAAEVLSLTRSLLTGPGKPADAMFCASALAGLATELQQAGARKLRTFIVRSVTLEPILPILSVEATLGGYLLETRTGGFGSYVDELMNPSGAIAQFQPDLVLIVLDADELAGNLPDLCAAGAEDAIDSEIAACAARIEQLLRSFRSRSSARIVLQGLLSPAFTSLGDVGDANLPFSLIGATAELNRRFAAVCRATSDCIFFDVDRLAARHGAERWRDTRMFLASSLPVATEFFRVYAQGLVRSFSPLFRAPRKVLCTDLDNTFWGGILGEDGPEGIATGSAYPGNCYIEYQRVLKQLSARGILLAIVSKNNRTDVQEAFETRSADLALKLGDFVATKISWDEKSTAIRELSEELSLGLDSFVFVDDNPVECEAIRQQLPEVAVLQAPVDEPWKLAGLVARQSYFDTAVITRDDLKRVDEYRAQAQRAELASAAGSREEFLGSLGIVCTFQSALQAPLARAVQLLGKTNQFNVTTRRRSAAEIEEFAAAPGGQAIVIRVRDRFGDAGVVGLALARTQGAICTIDCFLLSCRVIGRGVETALLAQIGEQAQRDGATRLLGEFIPTKKNAPSANFFTDHGFIAVAAPQGSAPDSVFYELDLTTSAPASPAWIALEGTGSHELSASPAVPA